MTIMNLIEILRPDFVFNDDRGTLCQITHNKFAQTNAVFTKKNAVRGNSHYHENTDEVFFIISGCVKVNCNLGGEEESHIFKSGDMFKIYKNVRHTFEYLDDTYLVAFYTERIEKTDGTKDIISE